MNGKPTKTPPREEDIPEMDIVDSKEVNREEQLFKESDYYKRNVLPVDRGWSWMVCFAGFLVSFNFAFGNQTMAIQFLEVIDLFDTSLTTASLIFLLFTLGAAVMSTIATNFIVPKIGEKGVVSIAGLTFSLSSVGFYISPNIETFLMCSAVKGLSMGAMFVPSISLLRHYFHLRRSIAQTLARAGASAAAMTVPALIRYLRNEYGVRGAFLIGAGIELHIVFGALLLRPVGSYKFKPDLPPLPNQKKKKKKDKSSSKETSEDRDIEMTLVDQKSQDRKSSSQPHKNSDQDSDDKRLLEKTKTECNTNCENRENAIEPNGNGVYESKTEEREILLDPQTKFGPRNPKDDDCNIKHRGGAERTERRRTLSTNSVGVPHESTVALDYIDDEDGGKDADEEKTSGCGRYTFFQLWAFRAILVFAAVGSGNIFLKNFVPTISVKQGATLDEAALMLTLMGAVDLVSRISLGFFADTHILKPSQIVAVSHIVLGVTCQLTRFFNTFQTLMVMTIVIGIFIGTRISMMPLVIIEVVGVEMMPQAFSIITTIGTFSASAMNPALSAVAESFGGFVPVMHILGLFFFTSASICLSLPLFNRIDKRKGRKPV